MDLHSALPDRGSRGKFCPAYSAAPELKLDASVPFAKHRGVRSLKFLLAYTVGVIRDPRLRRQFMFYALVAALVMLFAGSTFLDAPLRRHVYVFAGYWFACAWLTISALLLALYDMVAIRAAERRERRRIEREYLAEHANEAPRDDEDPR